MPSSTGDAALIAMAGLNCFDTPSVPNHHYISSLSVEIVIKFISVSHTESTKP